MACFFRNIGNIVEWLNTITERLGKWTTELKRWTSSHSVLDKDKAHLATAQYTAHLSPTTSDGFNLKINSAATCKSRDPQSVYLWLVLFKHNENDKTVENVWKLYVGFNWIW